VRLLLLGAPQLGGDCWHDDIAAEAKALGWDVVPDPRGRWRYPQIKAMPADEVVKLAKDVDLLLWARTHSHNPLGDAETMLRRVEDLGVVTVGLHLDLYWGMPRRELRIGAEAWWTCQHVYTADGGPRDWACKGVRQHRWCPPAFGTRNLGRAKPAGRHRYVFFGGSVRGIHGEHRARLLDWAKRRWGSRFGWYGQATRGRKYGAELSGLVSYADVVLGDSAGVLPRCDQSWPCYWSDRVVRMMGRGAVFAHPATTGMAGQGFDETTMIPFKRYDFKTIGERIESMSTSERAAMRDAAVQVVADRHLWRHRLQQIAADVGLA